MTGRSVAMFLLLAAASPAGVDAARGGRAEHGRPSPCEGADVDPWVTRLRDRVVSWDLLAKHAIEHHGPPIACEGRVTTEFEGTKFGVLRLGFAGGTWFEVATMPPESSVATLRSPAGFDDEDAARELLEAYCAEIGVEIDWTRATPTTEGDERIETYSDPDDGLNASASLVFVGDTLVALRFSLAL